MSEDERGELIYNAGKISRDSGDLKSACPYGEAKMFERCWWLAGWNDRDMEKANG